jgi:NAD(P)H-dependent FMN reductase
MSESPLHVLAVVGSLNKNAVTRIVIDHAAGLLRQAGVGVDVLDFLKEPLALFNPDSSHSAEGFEQLRLRVERADAYILGTPDYHGSISSTMKNFLDHFWHEFAGKLFATIVASHEKGLTVTDQLRTVARQCYGWSLPYGLSFTENVDVKENKIVSDSLKQRLEIMVRDVRTYGTLIAQQRQADLAGSEACFLARYRK